MLKSRLIDYAVLMRLNRPIGIFLLLWPTLWALWLAAQGLPQLNVLAVFILGVILMRSAGCVINDYADRYIDPQVSRTADRPLAAGRISPTEALLLFVFLSLCALFLVLFLNKLTVLLAVPAVFLAATYPFTKRFIHLPQVYLGVAFGWSIPMAFAAQTGQIPPVAWALFITNLLWVVVYDTFYAMADREDDQRIGVKSTAILFGRYDRIITSLLQIQFIVCLWLIGRYMGLGFIFYLGMSVAVGLCVYQQFLIRDRTPDHCFHAFLNNNWVGASVFAGIAGHYSYAWLKTQVL